MFRTKSNIYDGTNFTSNIYDGADFTSVKPYFKNVINSIKLPLGCIFYTTLSFAKKPFVKNRAIFSKFEITQWNAVISKEGFLN